MNILNFKHSIKYSLILLILVLFIITGLSTASATEVDSYSEMNNAIQEGENVILNQDIVVTDEDISNVGTDGINITHDVTIDGQGHYIDASNKTDIFRISNSSAVLSLNNITLMNSYGLFSSFDKDININATNTIFINTITACTNYSIENIFDIVNNLNINGTNIQFINSLFVGFNFNINGTYITFTNNVCGFDGVTIDSRIVNIYGSNIIFVNASKNLIDAHTVNIAGENIIFTNFTPISNPTIASLMIEAWNVNITGTNIKFTDNNLDGGIIRADNITIDGTNIIFANNTGGALHMNHITIDGTNIIFANNTGGAINLYGTECGETNSYGKMSINHDDWGYIEINTPDIIFTNNSDGAINLYGYCHVIINGLNNDFVNTSLNDVDATYYIKLSYNTDYDELIDSYMVSTFNNVNNLNNSTNTSNNTDDSNITIIEGCTELNTGKSFFEVLLSMLIAVLCLIV